MAWIILEGIDRSGKSTVAELYKSQGYEVVHMTAPDKKYKSPGYTGPSYLDDMLEMYLQYDGQDICFDRSIYGEAVWPQVYGRDPMLSEEDIEVLQEFEERNNTMRILMVDPDAAGHWKRCVDNNEPLNAPQFRIASSLYNKMAHKYNFIPKQLSDFNDQLRKAEIATAPNKQAGNNDAASTEGAKAQPIPKGTAPVNSGGSAGNELAANIVQKVSGLDKLEKANAISAVLSKRLIKQRGEAFDELEREVSEFLKGRLDELLGEGKAKTPSLSDNEVQVLKLLAKRFLDKEQQEKAKPQQRGR